MPSLANLATKLAVKIPLESIRETGNVRLYYEQESIIELAESIKANNLINPITVKELEPDENGNKQYELIAGHRRIRAFKYLVDNGEPFTSITACIVTGNKLQMQLIENIQRENLNPKECEAALKQMLENGATKTQIAKQLSKSVQWVDDTLAGASVREIAEKAGINTDGIAAKSLSQFRTLKNNQNELISAVNELKEAGGTYRGATAILKEKKGAKPAVKYTFTMQEFILQIKDYIERNQRENPTKAQAALEILAIYQNATGNEV